MSCCNYCPNAPRLMIDEKPSRDDMKCPHCQTLFFFRPADRLAAVRFESEYQGRRYAFSIHFEDDGQIDFAYLWMKKVDSDLCAEEILEFDEDVGLTPFNFADRLPALLNLRSFA